MKLYYIPFACSQAIHIMLNELGTQHELISVDPATKKTAKGEPYNNINPNGYVPALILENQEVLTEVPAILQYLQNSDQTTSFYRPKALIETAKLQALLNFLGSELHKAFVPFWYQPDLTVEDRQLALEKLAKKMDYLESLLADDRAYLLGEQYSIADIYAFVLISWCTFHDIDIAIWPNIFKFYNRLSTREAIKKTIALES